MKDRVELICEFQQSPPQRGAQIMANIDENKLRDMIMIVEVTRWTENRLQAEGVEI